MLFFASVPISTILGSCSGAAAPLGSGAEQEESARLRTRATDVFFTESTLLLTVPIRRMPRRVPIVHRDRPIASRSVFFVRSGHPEFAVGQEHAPDESWPDSSPTVLSPRD